VRALPFSTARQSLPATCSKKIAAEFAGSDSISCGNDSRYFMYGIKHNKTIAAKTLALCLKSSAHLDLICLSGGLKLN
jgi:hypothetical protein